MIRLLSWNSFLLHQFRIRHALKKFWNFLIIAGEQNLLQFRIGNPKFTVMNNGSTLKAKFTLNRNPSYMIINIYVPSFCTVIMTIVPLYLRHDTHFSTTITLVLTSILCLFTLLQSSVAQIPKTAYLKFIDYWNILVLAATLANFFALVFWEMVYQGQEAYKWSQIKTCMRILIPLCTLMGVTVYCVIGVMLYSR